MFWSETERWREQVIFQKPVPLARSQQGFLTYSYLSGFGRFLPRIQKTLLVSGLEDWLPTAFCRVKGPG